MNKRFETIAIILALVSAFIALLAWLAPFNPIGTSPLVPQATTPASSIPTQVVFSENFESDHGNNFIPDTGNWSIVDDGTDNQVLNGDSIGASWSFNRFLSAFSDGIIEYRVRVTEFGSSGDTNSGYAGLIFRDTPEARYGFGISLYGKYASLSFQGVDDISVLIEGQNEYQYTFQKGVWYSVRVEANGGKMKVYVDSNLAISVEDSRIKQGRLLLSIGPNTVAQFDDIKVSLFIP